MACHSCQGAILILPDSHCEPCKAFACTPVEASSPQPPNADTYSSALPPSSLPLLDSDSWPPLPPLTSYLVVSFPLDPPPTIDFCKHSVPPESADVDCILLSVVNLW